MVFDERSSSLDRESQRFDLLTGMRNRGDARHRVTLLRGGSVGQRLGALRINPAWSHADVQLGA